MPTSVRVKTLPKRRRLRRSLWFAAVALILLAAVIVLLQIPGTRWKAGLGEYLIYSEPPEKADLIVVLGGDFWGSRVLKGADLGMRGYARRVLISGPPYRNQPESDLAIQFLMERGYPRDLFLSYPIRAENTIDEARELKRAFDLLQAKRILIVTSDYHTRRTSMVFRGLVPGYHYRFIAAKDFHLNPDSWWMDPESTRFFYAEWSKIIGTLMIISWQGRL